MPDEPENTGNEPKPGELSPEVKAAIEAQGKAIADGVVRGLFEKSQESVPRQEARPDPEPTTDDIDKQISDAVAAGESIGPLLRKRDEITEARFARKYIDPLRAEGGAAISSLAEDAIKSQPHYSVLKTDIDKLIAGLGRGTVVTKAHYEWAYKHARGERYDDLRKIDEENALRKKQHDDAEASRPGLAGRTADAGEDENATFDQAFGTSTAAAFKLKNTQSRRKRSEDDEAREMGFTDKKDMLKQRKQFIDSEDVSLGLDR